jgi:hypothetical protein
MKKTEVLDTLAAVLSPYLGATMATASARTHCDKLAINGDEITSVQADALLGRLSSGLNVFIGRERAAVVLEEMKRALAQGSAAP